MRLATVLFLLAAFAHAAEKVDAQAIAQIRYAALNHSQIVETAGYLADVIGPRLTGSPNYKRAAEYARDRLSGWGLRNAHLEPWGPFGRGWSLEGFTANMLVPGFSPLIADPKAWSPPTNGVIRGEAIFLDVKTASDLDRYKGKLKGKIVLFSAARPVDPLFEPPAQRRTDDELQKLANAPVPPPEQPFHFSPEQRATADLDYRKWQFLQTEGAAVVLQPAYRDGGTVYVTSATVPYPPDVPFDQRVHAWDQKPPAILPQINVAAEQYNRLVRLAARGIAVRLEIGIAVRFYDDDPMTHNVIAEIPGTDLKEEVVMVGGCLDSWHAGTGATDNAAGAATAMEVMRILQTLDLKPRRTIRIGLWSAEEQGTLGSRAYLAAHLKPGSTEYAKFDAYFNFDYGTGRIRGLFLQGNAAARPIFSAFLEPFRDLGATTLSLEGAGSTDHIPFDEAGLPGFQWIRDYMEGQNTRAPHTNMDTYDHILPDDLKQSAAVAASLIYHVAMRDQMVPRKP
jgi:carboxypeptidase Q